MYYDPDASWEASLRAEAAEAEAAHYERERAAEQRCLRRQPVRWARVVGAGLIDGARGRPLDVWGARPCEEFDDYSRAYRAAMSVLHPRMAHDPQFRAGGQTRGQERAYERYSREQEREHEAFVAAGERDICEGCGQRAVTHRTVCTLGYPGHPGADYSDYAKCENCGWGAL